MSINLTRYLSELQSAAIARINKHAEIIILAEMPDWKQRNFLARSVELSHKKAEQAWTTEETTEWNLLQAKWDWAKSVRTASNVATAAINAATTGQQIYTAEQSFYNQTF